ncbi:hypothetical protein MJO29_002451 [Puccinia striiformis f. sp. tritici]|nr:hypothetical protein MJO29_002451 [Puccinia striiformis f. sp. tritici]
MASTICLTRLAQHSPRQITITRISFIRSLASTSTRGSTKSKTSTTLEKVCDILGISKLIKPTIDAEKVVKKTRAKRKTTESVKQKTDQVAPKNEDPSKDVGSPQKDEAGETAAPSKKQTAKKSTKPKKAVSSSPKAKKTTTTEVDKTPTSESSSKSSPDPSKESPQDPSAKSAQDPSNEFSQPSNESSHDSTKKSSQEPPKKSSEEPSTKSSEEPPKKSSQKPSKKTSKEPSKECTRKATNKPSVKTKKIVLPVPKESIPQEITSAETRIINSLEPKKTFPPEPEQTSPAETEKRSTPEPETTLPPEPEKTSPSKPEQTSPPEPEKTSPSEPEKTSLPGPEKSSSAEPEKTLPAEPEKTSPPELGKTSSEPEKTSPPEPETTPPREPEIISSPQPEEISPAEPDETSSSEPAKTSPAEPAKTSPPEPDKTSPPEPEETSLPETAKTSPAEPGQTSPLEPEYTSPPEPELTSIPETAKTSPAKPRKTSPAEPGKTSPAEPGKASLLEPEKPASSEMKPDAVARKSLELLPLPHTKGTQKKKAVTIDSALIQFDKFVSIGSPPSQNPCLYSKEIPKFVLDSRLRFPHAVLLTRVGSFYEVYFDQAVTTAKLLNIKQGETQFSGEVYPCTRFPLSSLQKHLETLLIKHRRVVAISEEEISSDEDGEIRRTFRIIRPASQKTTPAETKKTTSLEPKKTSVPEPAKTAPPETKPDAVARTSLELLPLPQTKGTQKKKAITIDSALIQFDKFVTIGSPPSQNPSLYSKEIPKFVLDSRLRFPHAVLLTCVGSFYEVYFDQAVTTAKLLNIKQDETQFSGEVYPCTRFPLSSLQKHLETLLNKHRRVVAISEEEISSDEDVEIRRTFRIIRPGSQKTTPAETKKTTSLEPKKTSVPKPAKTAPPETKPDAVARTSLELLPLPQTKGTQKKKAITIDSALIQFDKFVTIGSPPSQNPSLYSKKVPKFVLDSRLRFPDAILLTCVGSFYEVYFDQAVEVAELLNIKQGKTQFSGYAYPFTGFPLSSLQRNLKTLVNEHNRVVAIAEEETPTDEEIERRIVRIITPGTIVDENLIDDESYNYLLSVHQNQLAWLDVSTGSYFQTTCDGGESELLDQICRISPKEIIISADSSFCIPPNSKAAKLSILITKIKNLDSSSSLSNQGLTAEVLIAIYIKRNLLPVRAATRPLCVDALRHLKLDAEAIDSLEIIRTQNGKSEAGSLLSTISRTLTSPGKRLLRDRIMSPSRVLAEIETRLDLVEKLVVNHTSREDIQDTLREIEDIDYVRLLQRINLGQGTIQDLASMIRILKAIETISSTLSAITVPSPLGSHLALQECISDAIGDLTQASAAQAATENTSIEATKDFFSPVTWNVRFNLSKELGSMHDSPLSGEPTEIPSLTYSDSGLLFADTDAVYSDSKDLKLQVVPKLGAVLSIIKARKAGQELTSKLDKINGQTLIDNGSRVVAAVPEWTKMHASIERLRQELIQAEQRIMKKLFDQVTSDHVSLNQSFQALAALDVAQSFATFAVDSNCVRPSINPKRSTTIVNGRHPIAERALSSSLNGSFIPNSIVMHDRDGLVQIITGPNNGGKSTYLRQLGIIHILAQAGSFVPAESAKLGVVHQIFTRFGSFDNVVLGKGTFLIEMEETCKILKSADQMSLVLMDEVGRGTGIEDGLSIAYGVLRYLIEKSQCRTLFSTHLPHVGSLLLREDTCANGDLNGLKPADYMKIDRLGFFCFGSSKINAHTEESQGEEILNFSYEIQRGLNPNSSGIDIAKLVGLPKEVIAHATTIKSQLGNHSLKFQQDHPQSKKT